MASNWTFLLIGTLFANKAWREIISSKNKKSLSSSSDEVISKFLLFVFLNFSKIVWKIFCFRTFNLKFK